MKRIILFAVVAAVVCACSQGPKVTLTVENQLAIDRSAELVEISVDKLSAIPLGEGETYVVRSGSKTVPSQVTHDGLLLFRSGLGANEKATFTVKAGAAQEFATKTKGRLAPERFDDFIWENDRVAFRIYGEALVEERSGFAESEIVFIEIIISDHTF